MTNSIVDSFDKKKKKNSIVDSNNLCNLIVSTNSSSSREDVGPSLMGSQHLSMFSVV